MREDVKDFILILSIVFLSSTVFITLVAATVFIAGIATFNIWKILVLVMLWVIPSIVLFILSRD